MVINTNSTAQNSADLLATSSASLAKSLQRLSSGRKIITPDDDSAGLAVSMKFDAQSKRIGAAVTNISNAISFTKTQDGYLGQVSKALNRMSELAVAAQDVTKTATDKSLYNEEFKNLASYIGNIADKDFNGVSLFTDTAKSVTVDSEAGTFSMAKIDLRATAYAAVTGTISGGESTTALTLVTGAPAALTAVKAAITQLASDRSTEGASLTRLNYSKDQLTVQKTNIDSANSVISDVDVATESTNFAKQNILVQSGTAMLAQANVQGQSVLRLLG
jgi:flagellin